MIPALSLQEVSKVFRQGWQEFCVLHQVSLEVLPGELFGLLGGNGAGKTTTLKLLAGLLYPTQGQVQILGKPAHEPQARHALAFLPENPQIPPQLKALEFLRMSAGLHGLAPTLADLRQVLQQVGLLHAEQQRLATFSKGMVQRLGMAQALLPQTPILILDEPMSGLDPLGRQEFMEWLLRLRAQGRTILFSTHLWSEAQAICDRLAFLQHGRLVRVLSRQDWLQVALGQTLEVSELSAGARERCEALPRVTCEPLVAPHWKISLPDPATGWQVLEILRNEGAHLLTLSPTLRDWQAYWETSFSTTLLDS